MISAPSPASWVYADSFLVEDEVLDHARHRAQDLGCDAVSAQVGATMSVMAVALSARAVVELGTGAGVSGVYLLRGMPADGVLTTIDIEAENQRAAREAFAEAGVRTGRARVITGRGSDVLPRLTDGAYDMVVLDAEPPQNELHVEHGLRLLRPGGVLVVHGVFGRGRVADPARRDPTTVSIREATRRLRDDDRLAISLLPIGDGLLLAALPATPSGTNPTVR